MSNRSWEFAPRNTKFSRIRQLRSNRRNFLPSAKYLLKCQLRCNIEFSRIIRVRLYFGALFVFCGERRATFQLGSKRFLLLDATNACTDALPSHEAHVTRVIIFDYDPLALCKTPTANLVCQKKRQNFTRLFCFSPG
jgi:hypothetical protein